MSKRLGLAIVLLAFLFALFSGTAGVDFGTQWDQNVIKGKVNAYVRTGNLLPGEYHYPPVPSYLAASTTLPYAAPFILRYGTNWIPTQNYLLSEVLKNPNQAFLLNLRQVFVFFTVLAVLWVGLGAGQRGPWAGLTAAVVLALSWEINYQSRFVHPDGPTMQFVALSLMFCLFAFYKQRPLSARTWLYLAAAAAAVATATKYTAGLSILTVLLLQALLWRREKLPPSKLFVSWAGSLAVYAVVFLLLVPGVLLESEVFFTQFFANQSIYASGHGQHTIEPGWPYLSSVLVYLGAVAFSPYPLLAVLLTALAGVGGYALLRSALAEERWLGCILLSTPIIYILFLATHRVLFVRNLLQVLPVMALFAGFGLQHLAEAARQRLPRSWVLAPALLLLAVIGFNGQWIVTAAHSIQQRHSQAHLHDALAYLQAHPQQTVYITAAARSLLADYELPANLTNDKSDPATWVLFAYLADAFDEEEGHWPVNAIGSAPMLFGPREINMDWYASWPGVERLVLARQDIAWEAGRKFSPDYGPAQLLPAQTYSGLLIEDRQQLMLEMADGSRLFIMNSANPKIVQALGPLLYTPVSLSASAHSAERPQDVYVFALNGSPLLPEDKLRDEYNFHRFLLHLTSEEQQCLQNALGAANYQSLEDHAYGFLEYPNQLPQAVLCLD